MCIYREQRMLGIEVVSFSFLFFIFFSFLPPLLLSWSYRTYQFHPVSFMFSGCSVDDVFFFQEVNISLWPAVYAKLNAFLIVLWLVSTNALFLVFLWQTPRLFVFPFWGEETAAFPAACYYCCTSTTTFPQRRSRQLAAHSLALCWQIGWRLMPTGLLSKGKERETPTNTFLLPPSPPSVFMLFSLSSLF